MADKTQDSRSAAHMKLLRIPSVQWGLVAAELEMCLADTVKVGTI
jgi:hypothetical protein